MLSVQSKYNLRSVIFSCNLSHGTAQTEREKQLICQDLMLDSILFPTSYTQEQLFDLEIGSENNKFHLHFKDEGGVPSFFIFSLSPYVRLLREYQQMCDAYRDAVLHDNMYSIETIDMARRGLHNQAASLIQERFSDKIIGNHEAFRHLFTLMKFMITF